MVEIYYNCRFYSEMLIVGVTLYFFKMDGLWMSSYSRLLVYMKVLSYYDDFFLMSLIILDMILLSSFGSVGFVILFLSGGGESVFVVRWVFLLFDNFYLKSGFC